MTTATPFKKLLAEPLLHFALLGGLLFGVYTLLNPPAAADPDRIVVSAGQIETIATTFARVWQRPPTPDELKGLIDDYVVEEALCREAVKLGLDQDDTVIRRRLRQKMEFVTEDFAASAEPSDQELQAFLDEHPEPFRTEPRYSLKHVFLSEDRADRLDDDAAETLQRLRADPEADTSEVGDRILIPRQLAGEPRRAVVAQLGSEFADSLDDVPIGEWAGPLPSPYGLHLVLLTERTERRIPPLDEIRAQVARELRVVRRERAYDAFLDAVMSRYEVTIIWPGASETEGAPGKP
jgi:hypothetical protein